MRLACLIILVCCSAAVAADAPSEQAEVKRVLFLGNSYTGGPARVIKAMFKAEAPQFRVTTVTPGGKTLKHHHESKASQDTLAAEKWDVLVLQEQSLTPALNTQLTAQFHRSVDALAKQAKARDIGRVALYQTWGRRDGHAKFKQVYPDFTTMNRKLAQQYRRAAGRNKAEVAPVGEAFALIHEADRPLFRSLYKGDGSHPSAQGQYLVACVFFGVVTGRSPDTIKWRSDIEAETAKVLRVAAANALAAEVDRTSAEPTSDR